MGLASVNDPTSFSPNVTKKRGKSVQTWLAQLERNIFLWPSCAAFRNSSHFCYFIAISMTTGQLISLLIYFLVDFSRSINSSFSQDVGSKYNYVLNEDWRFYKSAKQKHGAILILPVQWKSSRWGAKWYITHLPWGHWKSAYSKSNLLCWSGTVFQICRKEPCDIFRGNFNCS